MKRALITGASGGIGEAIARKLADMGCRVFLHANRNAAKVEALASILRERGAQASVILFDVCDRTACQTALEPILAEGAIDILVNNAGIHADAAFPAMQEEQWQSVLDVTLNGFFHVTQPLVMPMVRQRSGRIISISSVAGVIGNRGQVNYAAAKSGLHAASKSLALELASRKITVNVVAPGVISTDMTAGQFDEATLKKMVPMQRAGHPDEVANLVGFLASDEAAYITGQVISINGGMA